MRRSGRRWRSVFWTLSVDDEVARELDFHVEMRTRELVSKGMSPEEARARAIARFGELCDVGRTCRRIATRRDRDMRIREWADELSHDLLFAARQMRKAPRATALVVLNFLDFQEQNRTLNELAVVAYPARREVLENIEAIPGVESAGATIVNPFRGPRPSNQVAPEDAREQSDFISCQWRSVTPGYFRVMGIPLLTGRVFDDRDRSDSAERVVLLGATLAQRIWPGEDPIGKRLRWNRPDGTVVRVVGVVGDVNDLMLDAFGSDAIPSELAL